MENNISVFSKKNKNNAIEEKKMLNREEIINSIPKECLNKKNEELAKTKNELRWRIFKIPESENEIIEMSSKNMNQTRLFMFPNGKWNEYKNEKEYDEKYSQFIIKEYYYYC